MTEILSSCVYYYLKINGKLPIEHEDCRGKSRGTKYQSLINKMILNDCKRWHSNFEMTWVDYNKAYNMVHLYWILKSLEQVQASKNIAKFIKRSVKIGKKLTAGREFFLKLNIKRYF